MMHSGSTGKIMFGLAKTARRAGHQVYTFSPRYYQRGANPHFPDIEGHEYFGLPFENMLHLRAAQITGLQGYFSWFGTKELLSKVSAICPDVIHLHNLHNRTINLPMLVAYIKRERFQRCGPFTTAGPLPVNVHILLWQSVTSGSLGAVVVVRFVLIQMHLWIGHALCGGKNSRGLQVCRA